MRVIIPFLLLLSCCRASKEVSYHIMKPRTRHEAEVLRFTDSVACLMIGIDSIRYDWNTGLVYDWKKGSYVTHKMKN